MTNTRSIYSDNVPGAWYVNDECICCGLCGEVTPAVFEASEDYDHHRVHHQPSTPEEHRGAEDARDRCPVEAIGNDRA